MKMIIISFFLFKEAYFRLMEPAPINTVVMLVVAVIGLVGNLLSVLLLRPHSQQSLNVKSAYMHLLSDTLSSVAVILGGIVIYLYEIYWLDPLLVFIIGVYILRESYLILKQALNILIQATPAHINVHEIVDELNALPEIQNPHHVHVWQLTDSRIHLEGHLEMRRELTLAQVDAVRLAAEQLIREKYGISHVTLQVEGDCCTDKSVISGS